MSNDVSWVDTEGTYVDYVHSNKFLCYKGIEYIAQPLNGRGEIRQKPVDFEFAEVTRRIDRDEDFFMEVYRKIHPAMFGEWTKDADKPPQNDTAPSFENNYFSNSDARSAYAIVQNYHPKRILEIGSGNSTKFFRQAINANSLSTKLISIDPSPRSPVKSIVDQYINSSVCDVDLSVFDQLEANDILFWDGCHICFNGSDVRTLFLEVLPRIKAGVLVHVHDIYLPFAGVSAFAGMPEDIAIYSPSEQFMLATYLLNATNAKIMLPLYHMKQKSMADVYGTSFWFVTG